VKKQAPPTQIINHTFVRFMRGENPVSRSYMNLAHGKPLLGNSYLLFGHPGKNREFLNKDTFGHLSPLSAKMEAKVIYFALLIGAL
jgi:hypothetical protein